MEQSESQFTELLANLVTRVNAMLAKQNQMIPMGLLMLDSGKINVFLAIEENGGSLNEALQNLQDGMIDSLMEKSAVAACIAYPDYDNEEVIAYLENTEHYCSKVRIPVLSRPHLHLDAERAEVEDGAIFFFGKPRK